MNPSRLRRGRERQAWSRAVSCEGAIRSVVAGLIHDPDDREDLALQAFIHLGEELCRHEPGVDVETCQWANGQEYAPGSRTAITKHVWDMGGGSAAFNWQSGSAYGAPGYPFNLTGYLTNSNGFQYTVSGNCTDVANLTLVLCASIGVDTRRRMVNHHEDLPPPLYDDGFWFKSIDPIGSPGATSGWWNYHHKNEGSYPGNEWDACLKYGSGSPPGELPTNVSDADYKTKLWDSTGSAPNNFYEQQDWDIPDVQ